MPFGQGDNGFVSEKPYFEGQVVTTRARVIRTAVNTTDNIAFGRVIVRGVNDNEAIYPTGTGQTVLGVSVATLELEYAQDANGDASYEPMRAFKFTDDADIGVIVENDVDSRDKVYFRHTAGAGAPFDRIGRFRSDDDGGNADQIPTARFLRSGKAGECVPLDFRPPANP